jgi:hypothetical protein
MQESAKSAQNLENLPKITGARTVTEQEIAALNIAITTASERCCTHRSR